MSDEEKQYIKATTDLIPFGQEQHVPTVLLLDTSDSMNVVNKKGIRNIDQLNEGLVLLKTELMNDDKARKRADIALVSFGGEVKKIQDFTTVDNFDPPVLHASSNTPMGEAILLGMDLIETRKQLYKAQGVQYFRPWIFLMTDGAPTDMRPGDAVWDKVVDRITRGEAEKHFSLFVFGADNADMNLLKQLSTQNPPVLLAEGKIKDFFKFLSNSTAKRVNMKKGEQIEMDVTTLTGSN